MNNLTVRKHTRWTPEDWERVTEQAHAGGVTASEFIRRRALGKKIASRFDRRLYNEIRRLGGLLKHLSTVQPEMREEFGKIQNAIILVLRRMPR